ncbi:molybdopterin-guanine dinucleotide biosynthesis protein B [Acidisoma cladoniae]|jgi:molybdopterin-guanine dinucleotide biosynthesis protein B|uniref:molybdopterin-guanine dinucleotide biosynthesis protein B n=1 Tax=Acidisoma cladoniae TaxID=3040935 RepID=UPI00254E7054|nr:molybdopterin-guanine dinucleotide biosynthesis protein B [Acidisoma sp. PAMC 29798]
MKVFGFAGWSGAGKTTLIRQVITRLVGQGLRVSTLKHAHHAFDIDHPGKDSWEHRKAGASEVLVVSDIRWALMHELNGAPEPSLGELLGKLAPADLVLIEGFKRSDHPKMEVYRAANGKPPLHPEDSTIIGIASDSAFPEATVPVLPLDDIAAIAEFARDHAQ